MQSTYGYDASTNQPATHTASSLLILGRQPALSIAELESLFGAATITALTPHIAGLSLPAADVDFSRLGGSTKLATILTEVSGTDWQNIEKSLQKLVRSPDFQIPSEGKFHLGVSAYGFPASPTKLTALGLTLKKIIRSRGTSVRTTPNTSSELSTAQVYHNRLASEHGAELLIINAASKTIIARTVAVQDIDNYTLRDRGRPKRDARVGMLPPKLAQIILNLASKRTLPTGTRSTYGRQAPNHSNHPSQSVLLDPFCGTGVLLQEALRSGYAVYGTDLEPRMIDFSQANLAWAQAKLSIAGPTSLEVGDATTHQWKPQPDLVACETYLGRPFTTTPTHDVLEQTISDVNIIIKKFLNNLFPQIAPDTRLCLAVPAWQTKPDEFRYLPIVDSLEKIGYNRVEFERVSSAKLLYYREGQVVARQLLVLTRK